MPRRKLDAERLRFALREILEKRCYRDADLEMRAAILQVNGLQWAAEIIEDALKPESCAT